MKKTMSLFILMALSFVNHDALASRNEWNAANDPAIFYPEGYEANYEKLPKAASLPKAKMPWSDTYWPSHQRGISNRWMLRARGIKSPKLTEEYDLLTKEAAFRLNKMEIADLSPAEKFDLARGRYDFPTVQAERNRTKSTQPKWWGLCHGWSPASINHTEPKSIEFTNDDGVTIPFGVSDVKALLTYYYGIAAYEGGPQIGTRCSMFGGIGGGSCNDPNPASLHIVLGNNIGIQKTGFVADMTRGRQVWNQPIYAYDSSLVEDQEPSRGSPDGTVRTILVRTLLSYTLEIGPSTRPVVGTRAQNSKTVVLLYYLDLDANGKILGGKWHPTSKRPDFLWKRPAMSFKGDFEILNQIYQPNLGTE